MARASEKLLTGRLSADGPDNRREPAHKRTSAAAMMESIFACKWSARILTLVRDGVNRPGAMTRGLDGLATKVLNECLRRLISFGLMERMSYPEIPPRVEYKLTKLGERFALIVDAVKELQGEIDMQHRSKSDANTGVTVRTGRKL